MELLRCPHTHQALRSAELDECIRMGHSTGLVTVDRAFFYPITDGIAMLLKEDALPLLPGTPAVAVPAP